MSFVVEICHPNEIRWKIVDEFNSSKSFMDHIETPAFATFIGLLVRVRKHEDILYSGIFGDGQCFDVGPKSRKMEYFRWVTEDFNFPDGTIREQRSLWDEYIHEKSPKLLAKGMSQYVSAQQMALAACACARETLGFFDPTEKRPLQAIEATERWAKTGENEAHVESLHAQCCNFLLSIGLGEDTDWDVPGFDEETMARWRQDCKINTASWACFSDLHFGVGSAECAFSFASGDIGIVMAAFKKAVPFYDIAIGVTQCGI